MLEKLLQEISEVSYDLISRIIPGAIVVAAAASNDLPIPGLALDGEALGVSLQVAVFLAYAYAVGLTISTLVHVLHIPAWFVVFPILTVSKVNNTFSNLGENDKHLTWNPFISRTILGLAHDFIKRESPEERGVVIKLFAEVSLLYSLGIGFVVVLYLMEDGLKYWAIPTTFFIAAIIRSVRTWSRHSSILSAIQQGSKKNLDEEELQAVLLATQTAFDEIKSGCRSIVERIDRVLGYVRGEEDA